MKKHNKIIVAVSPDPDERRKMIRRIAVELGFAMTPGDAGKLTKQTPHDYDLNQCYFVLAENYNFRESPLTTYRLIEMAARGIAVVVGTKRLPREAEVFCEVINPEDL
jgi:hypothetical protein